MNEKIPQGIIYNLDDNKLNYSYAHSALQSLCFLEITNNLISFFEHSINNIREYSPLSYEFLNIIKQVKEGITPESKNIISNFEKSYKIRKNSIISQQVLSNDPFHFLYFLLSFLHSETNAKKANILYDEYNISLEDKKNDNNIYNLFTNFNNAQNSLISNDFLNILKYRNICEFCGEYFFYYYQIIYRINLDTIRPNRDKEYHFELSELFKAFTYQNNSLCKYCNTYNCKKFTRICFSKIIIIYLERENHFYQNDVNNILDDLDLNDFISISRRDKNLSTIYKLKSVVSLAKFGEDEKYLAFCQMSIGNLKNIWVRYIDSYYSIVQLNDITIYEPQLLIYERIDLKSNNNANMINMNNNNLNNNIYKQMNNFTGNPNIINNQPLNYNNNNQGFNNMINNNMINNNKINNNNAFVMRGNMMNPMNPNIGNINYNNNLMMSHPNIVNNINNINNLKYPIQPQFSPNMQMVNNSINTNQKFSNSYNNIQLPINNNFNNLFNLQSNQFNNIGNPNMQININNNPSFNNMPLQRQNSNLFNFAYANQYNPMNFNK